jgi:hypothetical protein
MHLGAPGTQSLMCWVQLKGERVFNPLIPIVCMWVCVWSVCVRACVCMQSAYVFLHLKVTELIGQLAYWAKAPWIGRGNCQLPIKHVRVTTGQPQAVMGQHKRMIRWDKLCVCVRLCVCVWACVHMCVSVWVHLPVRAWRNAWSKWIIKLTIESIIDLTNELLLL